MIKLKYLILVAILFGLVSGCEDKNKTIQPPGVVASKPAAIQVALPAVSIDKTRALFSLATKKEIGDKLGLVEMRNEGILIHPGETQPTKVSFKLSRTYQKLTVCPFIATLPSDALILKEAGTVGVEFLLDGRSDGRLVVDRDSADIKELDLSNVDTLTVVVDNGDGKPWYDWLILGVVEPK